MINLRVRGLFGCALMLMLDCVSAAEWRINPAITVAETYTDNVTLAEEDQTSSNDYITEIAPSVAVSGRGGRLNLNAGYTMQNLLYVEDSNRNQTHHQFSLGADAELVEDLIYLDVNSFLTQQLISPQAGIATDNLNVGTGRDDIYSTTITPSIRRNLGQYVELDASYSESWVNYETVEDSRVKNTTATLASGRAFSQFSWRLGFNQSDKFNGNIKDFERKSSDASLRYRIHQELSVVAYAGKEKSSISSKQSYTDGSYWSAGFFWQPSSYFSVEGTKGENDRQAHITWTPTDRTSLTASYLDRDVGIYPDNSWSGTLIHRTRNTTWNLSHSESITSNPLLVFAGIEPRLLVIDEEIIFDEDGRPVFFPLLLFDTLNDEFLRVQSAAGVSVSANKSTIRLNLADESRDYELSGRHAESRTGLLGWNWKLASRTTSDLSYSKIITQDDLAGETVTKVAALSIKRSIGRRSSGRIQVRRATSDERGTNNGYEENRVSAHFRMNF